MVDVILCCYKQERYIEKAVKSIFNQKTSEKVHLIVADDFSPDRTLEIIKSTAVPDWVEVEYLRSEKNLGIVKNYKRAFEACKNKYVFILEGDDWWHSEKHIQQHVDFLGRYPFSSMSMNKLCFYDEAKGTEFFSEWSDEWGEHKEWNLEEHIYANRLGNLSGCCFRTALIKKMSERIFEIPLEYWFADWPLGMVMAESGCISILKEPTSIYRIHQNGLWSGLSLKERKRRIKKSVDLYDEYFSFRYKRFFDRLRKKILFDTSFFLFFKTAWNKIVENKKKIFAVLFLLFLILLVFIRPEQIFNLE